MRDRSEPKTGEVTAIFGLPSFRSEWALWGITYPTFQIVSITSNKGTCEPVPNNLMTANWIARSWLAPLLSLLPWGLQVGVVPWHLSNRLSRKTIVRLILLTITTSVGTFACREGLVASETIPSSIITTEIDQHVRVDFHGWTCTVNLRLASWPHGGVIIIQLESFQFTRVQSITSLFKCTCISYVIAWFVFFVQEIA
jgi:hypothetical protein